MKKPEFNCLFCKIIKKEIPSQIVYEDNFVVGFSDISPLAKYHLLFIHKDHTPHILNMAEAGPEQFGLILKGIRTFSENNPLMKDKGFRIVINQGEDAGQTVFHTHFHVLFGEKLGGFGAKKCQEV